MSDKDIIVKSRRNFFLLMWLSGLLLFFFAILPKNPYVWPFTVVVVALMIFYHRYANFYVDHVEIIYPFRMKKITVKYSELEKARFRPFVFRAAPAVTIWFMYEGKLTKHGLEVNEMDGLLAIDLIKANSPSTKILGPWE